MAMRQARDPHQAMRQLRSIGQATPSVSNHEMVEVLKSSAQKAVMKLTAKKRLLNEVFTLQEEILKLAEDDDGSNLKTVMEAELFNTITAGGRRKGSICSANMINSSNNETLSAVIVRLFSYAEMLQKNHAAKQADGSRRRETRSSSPLHELIKKILELKRKTVHRVHEERQGASHGSNNLLPQQTQTSSQLLIPFHRNLVPKDEAFVSCPYCNHESVNLLEESLQFHSHNVKLLEDYQKRMKVWDTYLKEVDRAEKSKRSKPRYPIDPITGKEMTRKPRNPGKRELKQLQARCTCATMHCTQQGSDNGSTCIIKCRRLERQPSGTCLPVVGPRYSWDTFTGCTCPVCKCQCNKIWNLKDTTRIGINLAQQSNVLSRQEPSTAMQLQALLGSAMTGGLRAASDALGPSSNSEDVHHDRTIDATAELVCRQGRSQLTSHARRELSGVFGRSTEVHLPSGDRFDTRHIGRDNSHMYNNRLAAAGPSSSSGAAFPSHPPGMVDNLNPSYSSMSDTFLSAARNYQGGMISNAISGLAGSMNQGRNNLAADQRSLNLSDDSMMRQARQESLASKPTQATAGYNEEEDIELAVLASLQTAPPGSNVIDLCELSDEGGRKLPAEPERPRPQSTGPFPSLGDSRREGPSVPPKRSRSMSPRPSSTDAGRRIFYRIESKAMMMMHVGEEKLTPDQKADKRKAKILRKHLKDCKGREEDTGRNVAQADGVSMSQMSAYERGTVMNKRGAKFESPAACNTFLAINESDSDSD